MAYLGTPPQSGFITTAKQRVTSSTNNYVDLDHAISSIADVIVFVNIVKQDTTNLSLTTSTRITLGGTLVSSDIVEIHYLGKAVNTQTPATGTVTNDMLAGSITESKLAGSIGLDKLSATGTKSSSTFLRGDNTFASAGLSNWSENSGNLLPSNASYGIYLGVNSATSSNLLDDYEEGSWTPIVTTGGANPSYVTQHGRYVKIGNLCHIYMKLEYTSSSGNIGQWGGLPFTASNEVSGAMDQFMTIRDNRNADTYYAWIIANDTKFYTQLQGVYGSGSLQTPSDWSGYRWYMQGSYITA